MAKETFSGPVLVLGGLMAGQGGAAPKEYSDEIGPSLFWGGFGIPATGARVSKDTTGPGAIPCITAVSPIKSVKATLTAGAGTLTVAANAVANTPFTNLTTYAAGRAPVPIYTSAGVLTQGIGLDLGIDTATFQTAGTITLSVPANAWRYNKPGLWLAMLNGGIGGACLFTQVQSVNTSTGVITVLPAPTCTNGATGQICFTNRYNPNLYGSGPPTSIGGEVPAGSARISIPECGNGRGVGILGSTGGPANIPILIQGTDCYAAYTSEIINTTAGASTAWGKKTYDTFISATPLQNGGAFNFTVVTSDLIGLPISVLSANGLYQVLFAGAAAGAANYTIVPADLTNPATQSTGDPRGGIQLTANGPGAAPTITWAPPALLTVWQVFDPLAVMLSSGINGGPLLGVPSV